MMSHGVFVRFTCGSTAQQRHGLQATRQRQVYAGGPGDLGTCRLS